MGDNLQQSWRRIRQRYRDVFLIISPPRCSSTAFARVFWEQPSVRCYVHEPFDRIYHRREALDQVSSAFDRPLEIRDSGDSLVVKEMTFQVGKHFPVLLELTRKPIVFLIRDPRLSTWSRMKMRRRDGQDAVFPERESGWRDIERQILECRANDARYLVADSTAFRNRPGDLFPRLFESLDLPYRSEMLRWTSRQSLQLGYLGGEQGAWYRRVLSSTGLEPENKKPHSIDEFPPGFQPHLRECLDIYDRIKSDEGLISFETNHAAETGLRRA